MFEFVHRGRRVAAQIFDRVLVAEPVGALDRVVHVPAPVVLAHVAECGRDAALRRHGMRARREHFGDAGGAQSRFAAADHRAQARAAGADDHDVVDVILDRVGPAVDARRRVSAVGSVRCHAHNSERELEDAVRRSQRHGDGEEGVGHDQNKLHDFAVHIILDHDLHADPHVDGYRDDEQQHDDGDQRRSEDLGRRGLVAAEQHHDDDDGGDAQRNAGYGGQALPPELPGARSCGAAAQNAPERRADMLGTCVAHRGPPMARNPTIHSSSVIATEPIRLAAASHSRSTGPKPRPVSHSRWRMPPSV